MARSEPLRSEQRSGSAKIVLLEDIVQGKPLMPCGDTAPADQASYWEAKAVLLWLLLGPRDLKTSTRFLGA